MGKNDDFNSKEEELRYYQFTKRMREDGEFVPRGEYDRLADRVALMQKIVFGAVGTILTLVLGAIIFAATHINP